VRVQVLTPINVLDREKQLGVVKELTEIVAAAAGDPPLAKRDWVLITNLRKAAGAFRAKPTRTPTSPLWHVPRSQRLDPARNEFRVCRLPTRNRNRARPGPRSISPSIQPIAIRRRAQHADVARLSYSAHIARLPLGWRCICKRQSSSRFWRLPAHPRRSTPSTRLDGPHGDQHHDRLRHLCTGRPRGAADVGSLSDYVGRRAVLLSAIVIRSRPGRVIPSERLPELVAGRILTGVWQLELPPCVGAGMLDLDRARGTLANAIAPATAPQLELCSLVFSS